LNVEHKKQAKTLTMNNGSGRKSINHISVAGKVKLNHT